MIVLCTLSYRESPVIWKEILNIMWIFCPHRQWANFRLYKCFFLLYLNKTQPCLDNFNSELNSFNVFSEKEKNTGWIYNPVHRNHSTVVFIFLWWVTVTWLKYGRYGVKLYPINHSIHQSSFFLFPNWLICIKHLLFKIIDYHPMILHWIFGIFITS